jgi:hypothetical protein
MDAHMPIWRGATNTSIAPGRQKPSRRQYSVTKIENTEK